MKRRDQLALFLQQRERAIEQMHDERGYDFDSIVALLSLVNAKHAEDIYRGFKMRREKNKKRPGRRRLTEEKVRDIRRAFSTGETKSAIAKRFHVSHHTITDVVTNQTWKEN